MEGFLAISKALSDQNRVRALMALRNGELCVCQIIELLGLAPSTVSKHMSILKQAGLVSGRKEGRWMYYQLPVKNQIKTIAKNAIQWVFQALKNNDIICGDSKELARIAKQCLPKLCKSQRSN